MEYYRNLEKAMCHELEKLDKKYAADAEISEADAERADMLYHALKSAATYHAMKDADDGDYSRDYRRSMARGRDMRTGRYISRDDGYSGHWSPMEYIDPMWDRRY